MYRFFCRVCLLFSAVLQSQVSGSAGGTSGVAGTRRCSQIQNAVHQHNARARARALSLSLLLLFLMSFLLLMLFTQTHTHPHTHIHIHTHTQGTAGLTSSSWRCLKRTHSILTRTHSITQCATLLGWRPAAVAGLSIRARCCSWDAMRLASGIEM